MRRMIPLAVALALSAALAAPASAGPRDRLPKITGGGQVQNNNSTGTLGEVELITTGGFEARAVAPPIVKEGWFFGSVDALVYEARGEVQASFVPVGNPAAALAVHGRVVCIANLGASGSIDGDQAGDGVDANPDGAVWEIRFQVLKIDGHRPTDAGGEPIPVPVYGSLFVQDGGRADFADESFSGATIFSPECAMNPYFGLEPMVSGNISVK